jgi:hypothetical protein
MQGMKKDRADPLTTDRGEVDLASQHDLASCEQVESVEVSKPTESIVYASPYADHDEENLRRREAFFVSSVGIS